MFPHEADHLFWSVNSITYPGQSSFLFWHISFNQRMFLLPTGFLWLFFVPWRNCPVNVLLQTKRLLQRYRLLYFLNTADSFTIFHYHKISPPQKPKKFHCVAQFMHLFYGNRRTSNYSFVTYIEMKSTQPCFLGGWSCLCTLFYRYQHISLIIAGMFGREMCRPY